MALRGNGPTSTAGWHVPTCYSDVNALMPFWISFFHSYDGIPEDIRTYPLVIAGGVYSKIYISSNGLSGSTPPLNGVKWNINNEANTTMSTGYSPYEYPNSWHHVAIQFISSSYIRTYYDGEYLTGLFSPIGTITMGSIAFGAQQHTTELMAEIAMGSGYLLDDSFRALARGKSPLHVSDPDRILHYLPLRGDFRDLGRQRIGAIPDALAPAPVWAAHPQIEMPPDDMAWLKSAAGVTVRNRPRILMAA